MMVVTSSCSSAASQQFADQEAHAAGRMEVVHVGLAVGIDAGHQRHDGGEFGEILPGERRCRPRRPWRPDGCVWLVEPPVASRPTTPLTTAFSS